MKVRRVETGRESSAKNAERNAHRQRLPIVRSVRRTSVQRSGHRVGQVHHQSVWVGVAGDSVRRTWLPVAARAAAMWLQCRGVLVRKGASAKAVPALVPEAEDRDSVRQPWRPVADSVVVGQVRCSTVPAAASGNRVLASARNKAAGRDLVRQPWPPVTDSAAVGQVRCFTVPAVALGNRVLA